MQIVWRSSRETFTASASAESETVSASKGLRQEGLPVQILMEAMLGKRVPLKLRVGNTQVIAGVKKGYSKRLRHLQRTHRVPIGVMHDLTIDPQMLVEVEYVNTLLQKADIFTKALLPAALCARAHKLVWGHDVTS